MEAEFVGHPANRGRQRPYGWGWALQLVHEVQSWDDADASVWAVNLAPLARALTQNFVEWLPKATYPVRYGVHQNSAFGLSRALPYARARDSVLVEALTSKARQWFERSAKAGNADAAASLASLKRRETHGDEIVYWTSKYQGEDMVSGQFACERLSDRL